MALTQDERGSRMASVSAVLMLLCLALSALRSDGSRPRLETARPRLETARPRLSTSRPRDETSSVAHRAALGTGGVEEARAISKAGGGGNHNTAGSSTVEGTAPMGFSLLQLNETSSAEVAKIEWNWAVEMGNLAVALGRFIFVFQDWALTSRFVVGIYASFIGLLVLWLLVSNGFSCVIRKRRSDTVAFPNNSGGSADSQMGSRTRVKMRGYTTSLGGGVFLNIWYAVQILGQLILLVFTIASNGILDPFGLRGPSGWESLLEPYLCVFALSGVALLLSVQNRQVLRISFMRRCRLMKASVVLAETGDTRLACPVQKTEGVSSIEFQCARYVLDESEGRFLRTCEESMAGPRVQLAVKDGGTPPATVAKMQARFGKNQIRVPVPNVFSAIATEFASGIYVYQMYCVWSWLFNGYLMVGLMWLTVVLAFGITKCCLIVRRAQLKIHTLAQFSGSVRVCRGGSWETCQVEDLVPGDLFLIFPGDAIPCDCVLASGTAIVTEAGLNGHYGLIAKTALDPLADHERRENMLLAGAQVLDATRDNECGAFVVAKSIGGATERANLVREALLSIQEPSQTNLPRVHTIARAYGIGLVLFSIWRLCGSGVEAKLRGWASHVFFVFQAVNPVLVAVCGAVAIKQFAAKADIAAWGLQAVHHSCDKTGSRSKPGT